MNDILWYDMADGVKAFSSLRDAVLPYPVVQAHQIHEDRIAIITKAGTTREELEGFDAMITNIPGIAIGARTADCVPVLLYDPYRRAIAAIHSGWKGTVKKISLKTIKLMEQQFGTDPADLMAVIGPCIGPESFQVGEEVAEQFKQAGFPLERILSDEGARVSGTMKGGLHIDLWLANRMILEEAGIKPENISVSGIDTFTHPEFYSARREGTKCGRIINSIMLCKTQKNL